MNVPKEIKEAQEIESLIVAKLASSFTLLALVAYDSWGHQGTPAEMATMVVMNAKKQGNLGFLRDIMIDQRYGRL